MVLWIQVLAAIFLLDMIFLTYLYYRRNVFYVHDFAIWTLIWLVLLLTISFPSSLDVIMQPLSIIRVMDLLTMGAFLLSFSMLFIIFVRARASDRKIEKIVRELALRSKKQKK